MDEVVSTLYQPPVPQQTVTAGAQSTITRRGTRFLGRNRKRALGKMRGGLRPKPHPGRKKPKPNAPGDTTTQFPSTPPVGTPDDSIYQAHLNSINTGLANQKLGFGQAEQSLQAAYGFDPMYKTDPYTRASILARRAEQRERGTLNSMAAAGQLYSGALSNQRQYDAFESGQELDSARRELADRLQEIQQARLEAQSRADEGKASAFEDLMGRMEKSEPDPALFDQGSLGDVGYGDAKRRKNNIRKRRQHAANIRRRRRR